jgi:hypothetical protein
MINNAVYKQRTKKKEREREMSVKSQLFYLGSAILVTGVCVCCIDMLDANLHKKRTRSLPNVLLTEMFINHLYVQCKN